MGDSGGHFEKGRWVEDDSPAPSSSDTQDDIETRLRSAAGQIGRGIDELLAAGSDLIGTQEGRQHVCEDIRREGVEFINQARDRIMK
jgi:hypothetical protein